MADTFFGVPPFERKESVARAVANAARAAETRSCGRFIAARCPSGRLAWSGGKQ